MDRAISLEARRIDLTIELPFKLGPVRVDPRAHEISWGGECRRVQPLTLKVLVAFHDKAGEVVTRDELVDRCWDGRFVGEDVINRCVSLLRRVAAESGGFEIQTVPRTGYRLTETEARPVSKPANDAGTRRLAEPPLSREWASGFAALLALLLIGGGIVIYQRASRPTIDAVMLKPFDVAGDAALARTFAAGVSADVNTALSAAGVKVLDPDSSGQSRAEFVLSGHAELPGSDLHLTAELQDARDHAVLWSTTFTRSANQAQAMQEQVAANLAQVLHCAFDTSRQPGGQELDQDSIKLYLKACALEQAVDPPSDQIQELLKQVTAREPDFAAGWARLALFAANAAFSASPNDAEKLRAEARNAVRVALRLDPRSGIAYDAVGEMELGHAPFAELHRGFQNVLRFDPDDPYTTADECELLLRMGSMDESLRMCRRGVQLEPLSVEHAADLITALVDDSRGAEGAAMLERALRIWPDDNHLRTIHLDYEARFGSPDAALAILSDPQVRPQTVRDVTLELYRRVAESRKSHAPAKTREFISWLKKESASGQLTADTVAPRLAQLGDVNGAFAVAFAAPPDVIAIDPEFMWEPEVLSLRRDPRFLALAAKFHVADFWAATGMWPDFCSTPNWPYNCRVERDRLQLAHR